jgi:hypothetical protein
MHQVFVNLKLRMVTSRLNVKERSHPLDTGWQLIDHSPLSPVAPQALGIRSP